MLKNLKVLRAEQGMSQKQLADVIGVSQQSINKYENHNIEPDIKTLILLADCFNVSVDFLIGNTDVRRKNETVREYDLNEDELQIIKKYRNTKTEDKGLISEIMNRFAR